jgi:outer membrane receptor for Fe3+-dicitrate
MNERYIRFAGSAVLILSGLALVTTGVARGDEPADKTDETPDREESTFREEIEVIAEGPDFEIQRLEIEELESGRAANLAVALQTIPAVAGVRRAQNALEPVIRGLGWERVQTQLNGVPLYGACPARMDSPATLVAASAVREASVIKGLSSVTFGPDRGSRDGVDRTRPGCRRWPRDRTLGAPGLRRRPRRVPGWRGGGRWNGAR